MASLEAVTEGLLKMDVSGLAGQGARPLSDDEKLLRTQVFREQFADLSDADFRAAVTLAIGNRKPFYPTPGQLREFVRPQVSVDAAVTREAERAYANIVDAYERGVSMGWRYVRDTYGPEAADAFMAAGGDSAFAWCEPGTDQAFRQKRFVECFRQQVEARHAERAALQAGADNRALTHGEAKALLGDHFPALVGGAGCQSRGEVA